MEWKLNISVSPVCVVYHSKWSLSMLSVFWTHFCIGRGVLRACPIQSICRGAEGSWRTVWRLRPKKKILHRKSAELRRRWRRTSRLCLSPKRDVFSPNNLCTLKCFIVTLISFGPVFVRWRAPRKLYLLLIKNDVKIGWYLQMIQSDQFISEYYEQSAPPVPAQRQRNRVSSIVI